jgi:hypothetical protein
MQAAMEAGVTNPIELVKLNKYRCHQQVLYISDILYTGGKCLDKRYLTLAPRGGELVQLNLPY